MLPSFAQPSSIGQRYTVLQRLGGGAMGAVFMAMDEVRHERVAIKVPAASRHWRAEYERRVVKEIGILSALQHPNIIEIHDWGQDPQLGPYIVMEYIEGGSVGQLMTQRPGERLDPYEALRIAATVAEALAYAHGRPQPIIHRDIKPDNILVRRSDGLVKVTDFGLAAVLTGRRAVTQWGTPDYIAPEQALGKGADARSDMYGLSATLFHMLTGQRPPALGQPLPGRPSALMTLGVLDQIQARRLDFLIITLLAYDPDQRRPSPDRKPWRASEVSEELRALAERRPANLFPSPEDSAIFPALMTSLIPPVGAPARRPPAAPLPQAQPVPPPVPPAQPIIRQQAPPMPPPQRAVQAEQIAPLQPPAPRPTNVLPVPPLPMPAQQPPGGLPPLQTPVAPPAPLGGFMVPGQPPIVQVRPGPMQVPQVPPTAPPVQPAPAFAPPSQAAGSARASGFSSAEKEAITGLLTGAVGVVFLSLVMPLLPPPRSLDFIFDFLLRGLVLWGIGLLMGILSPRGRRGHFPFLAALITIVTLAIGFPLVQLITEIAANTPHGALQTLQEFLWLVLASPFLLLGTLGAWLAVKILGRDES